MRLLSAAALLLLGLSLPAQAQAPITIVVNFGAGGSADRMARLLAPELSEALGAQVIVKNTTGAAGAIGAAEVARARPDGTTLLLSTTGPWASSRISAATCPIAWLISRPSARWATRL